MDRTQKIKADLDAYRASKQNTQPMQRDIRADLEAYRASKSPSIAQQKESLVSEGKPVSISDNRAEPTLGGQIVREAIKAPVKVGLSIARGLTPNKPVSINSKYLGKTSDFLTEMEQTAGNLADKYNRGEITPLQGIAGVVGKAGTQALDVGGMLPVEGIVSQGAKTLLGKGTTGLGKAVRTSVVRGGGYGAGYDVGNQLATGEQYNPVQTVKSAGIGAGADLGLSYVAPKILSKVGKKIGVISRPTDELKDIVSKNIDNVYSGVTGDADQIKNLKSKAQKGLELYTKENKTINTKNPNELISSINKFGEKISTLARSATEKASKEGFTLDTTDAKNLVLNAFKNGDLPNATAKRLYRQIDSLGNDPLKIHDWVQDVNIKYGKKYQRGTIDDTAVGKIADDVAENFRKQLDFIVDRKGYSEAYGNNQELKRMLVAAAKKANKNVNFGDITTEAGLDAGIALLTGNPLYMARTMGSGLLRGVFSKLRNTSGLRSLKKASSAMSKMETKTRLPSGEIKPADILKQSKETQMFTPKNRVAPSVDNQNLSPNMYGSPKMQNANTKIESNTISNTIPQKTSKVKGLINTLKNDIKNNGQRGSAEMFKNVDDNLIQEARKYKSADEFLNTSTELTYKNLQENPYSINAYGKDFNEPVEYHRAGTIKKNGDIWLTDNPAGASQYSSAGGGTKTGSYIVQSKNPLIIDTAGGKYADGNIDINKILTKNEVEQGYTNNPTTKQKFIDYAKKNGYDAVQFADSFPDGEGGMRSLVVWNKDQIKTKSQLTNIWNKAHSTQGKAKIGTVGQVAGVTALGALGANLYNRREKKTPKSEYIKSLTK